MSDNIHVAVRVRPLIPREIKEDAQIHWKVENASVIYLASSPSTAFCFDRVFDARETNDVVYGELCSPIVESVMQGINGTIFAYGQTSSGKTFTMMGDAKNSGIIRSTIEDIFNAIENMPNREFLLRVSYMEIYNEMVVDLFSTEEKKNLKVQENTDGYISICGLEEIVIRSTQDVFNWMKKGERKRHIGETNMNERSSRSHTIFRMIIESRRRDTDEESAVIVSQFNFVDLAGSERAAETFTTDRFKESVSINKSLFTLSQVISQLSENDGQHISYRASKLTKILKNSLGGNARTVMICTVTPASLDQTLSTLKFASRAKCIKNKPQVNEILTDEALLKRYARKIKELAKQLEEQQNGDVKAMQLELEEKDRKIENLRQSLREIKEKLIVSHNPPEKFSAIPQRNQRRETWGGIVMKQSFRPPPLDNIKSFCHLPVLPTLMEESFSAIADLSSEFSPEYREDLLSGGSKFSSSSPHRRSLSISSSRFSFPKSTVNVEVQTENCLGNITDSDVPTDFGRAAFLEIKEENSKLRSDLESIQKKYEELREFTCLEKEICGTDNGWTNEIKPLQEKIKFLQEENTDLFAKLKSTSDKILLKMQAAETKEMEQLNEKEKDVSSLNEKFTVMQQEIESLRSQVQQMEWSEENVESLRAQFKEASETNLVYQNLVKDLEAQVKSLEESNCDLTNKMLKIESSYSDAQNEVSRLINELSEKDAIITNVDNQLRTSEKLSDDQAVEIKKLNDKVSELSDMIRNLSSQSESSRNLNSTCQNITVDDLQVSVGNESVFCGNYFNKSDNIRGSLMPESENKQMQIIQLNGQLEEYEEQIQTLSSKIEALNSNRIEASNLIEDLQAQIKIEKENNLHHQSTIETLKNSISQFQKVDGNSKGKPTTTETDELSVEEDKAAKDTNELLIKYRSLLEEKDEIIRMMVEEIHSNTACVDDIKNFVEDFVLQKHECLKESVDKVMSSYSEISTAISEVCQHFTDIPKEHEHYKVLIYAQEQEISALTDKLIKSESLLFEKESQLNLFASELAGMEDIVQDMRNQLEMSKDCLRKPLPTSCTKCLELKAELKCITDKISEEESVSFSLKNLVSETQNALSEKTSLCDNLLEQLKQAQGDISEYKKEIEDKAQIILDYKNHVNDIEGKIAELIPKKDSEISQLESQITDLQGITNTKESKIEDLRKQLEQSRTSILQLEDEVTNKKCTISNYENLINELEMKIGGLTEEMSWNKQQLTVAEETVSECKKEVEQKKSTILNYENHLNNLKKHFEGVLSEMRASHESEIQKMNDVHGKEMSSLQEDLEKQHAEEKQKLTNQFADELELKLSELHKHHYENGIKEKCETEERLKLELRTSHEKQLSFLKKELQAKETTIANKAEKLEKAESELAVLRAKNQKKNELLTIANERHEAAINAIISGKDAEIQGLKNDLENKITEIDALKRKVDIKRKIDSSVEESLSALKASHANEILQMSDHHEKEKQCLVESLMTEFNAEKKKISEELMSKLKASHENEIRQLNDLHERAKQSLIESLMAEFTVEREKLTDKFNKELEFKLSDFQKAHLEHSMRQKNEAQERVILELGSKYEQQLVALKRELTEKDNILRSKSEILEKMEGEMTALKMKDRDKELLISRINEEHQTAIAAVVAEKENAIQGLKHDLEYKRNECDTLKKEGSALLSRKDEISAEHYKNELSKITNKCEELNSEINKKNNELLQLKSEYEENVKKTEKVYQKIAEQDKLIQHLRSDFCQKSAECDLIKQQLEELSRKTTPEGSSETLESYKCRVVKEISAYKMKKDKEREHLKSLYEKEISKKTKIHDQMILDMKEKNEKLTVDFNSVLHERDELKTTCKDLETQNQQLVGVLKGETEWLEQQNSDVKAHKQEITEKSSLLMQLSSDFSKQSTELASLRNECRMLVGEINKLKNEIVARNEVCVELQKKIEMLQNSQNMSFNNKGEQDGSGKDKIEQLTQELVDEKLKNEKLLEGLKHWAEKAESYKLQVRHLKEAKECTISLDKLPKAVTTEESLSDKPSDEIVYHFQSGAIANYKLYMMDSELYQKNKEIDRLKKEIDRLKSVISSKRASISTKPGQNAAGVSTDQQPTETHDENSVPVFVKPRARKRSENDVTSIAKKLSGVQNENTPATSVNLKSVAKSEAAVLRENYIQGNIRKQKPVRRSSEVESENTIVTFVKPKPRAQSENGVSKNKPSESRSENTKPAFTFSSRVQTEVTAKGEKDIISTVKKPEAQNQSTVHNGNDITSMTKNPQGTPNENIPTVFVRPRSRTHDKITVQIQNDLPSALKTSGQDITPLFTKPRPRSQSEIDVSVVNKPSLLQNENGPPISAQHRPRASSESKTQSKNEGPSTMSEVENENMPFTFLKRSSAQNENGVNGKSLQPHRENIPPTLGRARHKVQSENDTPLGTRLSSQIQRNGVSLSTKPLSEEQHGNPCSASVEPLPSTVNRNIVASEKLQSERESAKTVSESVKSFSTMQNVDSVATTKPLTELQAVRNYEKPVSLVDTSGSNATKMVRDGFSTELKKSAAVPTDKVPQRGKRKFNESNECKQQ